MDELSAILTAWRRLRKDPAAAVLATVVHVEGSAYRRPGARMLICGDGNCVGSISGGCLEGDVTRKAAWWTADGKPALRVYDTTSEEASWEFGLGCNGVITLLLERLSSPSVDEALKWLELRRVARKASVLATVIRADGGSPLEAGDRLLWDAEGNVAGTLAYSIAATEIAAAAAIAFGERFSRLVRLAGADVFVEYVSAPQRLVIFGAGHDAVPLAAHAAQLGWSVIVADGRLAYAKPSRFPGAEHVLLLPQNADIAEVMFGEDSAVVMMTHNFPQDVRLLPQVLGRNPRYLGLLGPRSRAELLFDALGQPIHAGEIHAPAGLDIGGDSPSAIALAIIAEVQSVLEGRGGGPLKFRRGPIHATVREAGRVKMFRAEEIVDFSACAISQ